MQHELIKECQERINEVDNKYAVEITRLKNTLDLELGI